MFKKPMLAIRYPSALHSRPVLLTRTRLVLVAPFEASQARSSFPIGRLKKIFAILHPFCPKWPGERRILSSPYLAWWLGPASPHLSSVLRNLNYYSTSKLFLFLPFLALVFCLSMPALFVKHDRYSLQIPFRFYN